MSPRGSLRFRNLPLFGKLLLPFLVLMLIAGALGAFLIVRDLSTRAEAALDETLSRRSLTAGLRIHDRELYLLEAVNLAANLEGIDSAVSQDRKREIGRLLLSVLAIKTDLTFLAITDRRGVVLWESLRAAGGEAPADPAVGSLGEVAFVAGVLDEGTGAKASGFLRAANRAVMAVAAPICAGIRRCRPVGAVIAGVDVDVLAAEAGGRAAGAGMGAAIFDPEGNPLALVGNIASSQPPTEATRVLARRTERVGGDDVAALYSPLLLQDRPVGVIGVSIPTSPAFSSVRGAGYRLAFILLAAMAGVMGIGALLSRGILRQVRPLVETNRALGSGHLSARAPVLGNDELGELAHGVNQMAEQLQASYESLELRVAQRTAEVQRLLLERNELFASMSHEFRTPLAVIIAQADVILDPSYRKTTRWAKETGGTIKQSAAQLLSFVNDILNLAKAEKGQLGVDLVPVDLPKVMESLRGTIEALARVGGLEMKIIVPADVPKVMADPLRLEEVLMNLVDNAVKYTPPDGRVEVRAGRANGAVRISVSDTGAGIPAEAADRIFEPFFRVKGTATQRGQASSGLGLALTKRLVEAQGGEIGYKSQLGRGSTFMFSLPLAGSSPTRARSEAGLAPGPDTPVDAGPAPGV